MGKYKISQKVIKVFIGGKMHTDKTKVFDEKDYDKEEFSSAVKRGFFEPVVDKKEKAEQKANAKGDKK